MAEKASSDPGWNDPPLFSYEVHQAQLQNTKKTHLTKRVGYPPSLPACINTKPQGQKPPILPTVVPPKLPETLIPSQAVSSPETQQQEKEDISLSNVLENFTCAILQIYDSDKEKESSEVKRRLGVMETFWKENKFSPEVQERIYKLSLALKEGDLVEADSHQRCLMVDSPSVCSPWMSGIRHMLNSKRSQD